jgi:uncharacterized membrane protein
MRHLRLITFAAWFLLASLASGQTSGLSYQLTDLGRYIKVAGVTSSVAYAINENGQIAGSFTSGANQTCFLYTGGKGVTSPITTFNSTTSPQWCDARAINSSGVVAGSIRTSGGLNVAFNRNVTTGKIRSFVSPFGGNSFAYGIDDQGGLVGSIDQFDAQGNDNPFAVRWNSAGQVTQLSSQFPSYAGATNPTGSSIAFTAPGYACPVGYVCGIPQWSFLGPPYKLLPFVYTPPDCDNGPQNFATAVNSKGDAVGMVQCYSDFGSYGISFAELWQSGTVTNLDPRSSVDSFPGAFSVASAISSDDWVVGTTDYFAPGGWVAFLKVPNANCLLFDVNLLLDASGQGWTVVYAYGINTQHKIVGGALDSKGLLHAVLLQPNGATSPNCILD